MAWCGGLSLDSVFAHLKSILSMTTTMTMTTTSGTILTVFTLTIITLFTSITINHLTSKPKTALLRTIPTNTNPSDIPHLTPLQTHILFWDRSATGIITPLDIYAGFRALGFNIPFSLLALLIPFFFSYPTTLAHSWFPDPYFRIYVDGIHKAKHGSDTGVYDLKGGFREAGFEEIFREFGEVGGVEGENDMAQKEGEEEMEGGEKNALALPALWELTCRNRVAADPAGWTFALMEWGTTWVLLQRKGRVWKDDLRACYDGSLFWRLREERERGVRREMGYGLGKFGGDVKVLVEGWWRGDGRGMADTVAFGGGRKRGNGFLVSG